MYLPFPAYLRLSAHFLLSSCPSHPPLTLLHLRRPPRGKAEEDAETDERQTKAQVLTARKVEPKQAVLWMQMQRDPQSAACVNSTSGTVQLWGPTRQVLAMALFVGEAMRRSRGMAQAWDLDTEMHRVGKVMAMVDYGAAMGRTKGHTVQVVSPQASATEAADQGVTDLVQDGQAWWVVEPRGDRHTAVVYTTAPLKRVEHPLMRWVGEAGGYGLKERGRYRRGPS